jgi:CRISPR-associated protein Csd1
MILHALKGYYDRVAGYEGAKIAPPGYSYQNIAFAIILAGDGSILDVNDLRTTDGKAPRPLPLLVPQPPKRSGRKPPPAYLWDKTGFVFGIERSAQDKATAEENPQYRDAFRDYHRTLLAGTNDKGLTAFVAFLEQWDPARHTELRYANEMLDLNVVFRLDGDQGFLHDRPAAREIWARTNASAEATSGLCLVIGQNLPIARLHQSIKGVRDAQVAGASIVSFNQDSFTSYGKEQGANAPVSEQAAFAYTTALNELLRRDGPQKIQIGDATTVYWAESSDVKDAQAAETVFSWLNVPPPLDQQDGAATDQLRNDVMDRVAKGRPLESPEMHLKAGTKFYILGLAPNAARLSIRFWEATTLGALGAAFHQHWNDLRLDGPAYARPPAIWRLLSRTAPARRNQQGVVKYDTKNIPPNLAGEMMRSILTGRAYPRTLSTNILIRFRTDHEIDGLRVALVKACLVRDMRRANPTLSKETYVSLNRDDPDPAYRLGRLFAILEKTQRAAMDGVNATICDRYYGSASSTPQRVFAFLVKNSKNHLATLRKGRGAKWVKNPGATGGWLDRQIGDIYEAFQGTIPASLTLEAQSRFAIGYYHEKYAKRDDAPDDLKAVEPETDDATETPDNE